MRLDRLQRGVPIVGRDGVPSQQFQSLWQRTVENIESALAQLQDQIDLITAAQNAADAAQDAADTATAAAAAADAAATTAQGAADTANSTASLANSGVTGITITATDAGSDATINISSHTRVYADGTSVSVTGGSVTGLAYSTLYYIYYDDPARAGGAVTYQATTSEGTAAQVGNRHTVGSATTPAAAAGDTDGIFVRPPGVGALQ